MDQARHVFSFEAAVKDLERRWGLTVVSPLPPSAVAAVREVQARVVALIPDRAELEPAFEVYAPAQLHCTHLTLRRSSPAGPVKQSDLIRPGHAPEALTSVIARAAAATPAMTVRLDRIDVSSNGVHLVGECDPPSARARAAMLEQLNDSLATQVFLDRRPWDTDPERFRHVHVRIGFFKRAVDGYRRVAADIERLDLAPIRAQLEVLAIVHHRYRTLVPPHEGAVVVPLGIPSPDPGLAQLNLVAESR